MILGDHAASVSHHILSPKDMMSSFTLGSVVTCTKGLELIDNVGFM